VNVLMSAKCGPESDREECVVDIDRHSYGARRPLARSSDTASVNRSN
jgi:hypothetical protein